MKLQQIKKKALVIPKQKNNQHVLQIKKESSPQKQEKQENQKQEIKDEQFADIEERDADYLENKFESDYKAEKKLSSPNYEQQNSTKEVDVNKKISNESQPKGKLTNNQTKQKSSYQINEKSSFDINELVINSSNEKNENLISTQRLDIKEKTRKNSMNINSTETQNTEIHPIPNENENIDEDIDNKMKSN